MKRISQMDLCRLVGASGLVKHLSEGCTLEAMIGFVIQDQKGVDDQRLRYLLVRLQRLDSYETSEANKIHCVTV